MNPQNERLYLSLAKKEGWEIEKKINPGMDEPRYRIWANNQKYDLCHPVQVHLHQYRTGVEVFSKFLHMKAAHDYLWPDYIETWNEWEERRFLAHCEGYAQISLAAGASAGKSLDVAKIALLFWLSNPKRNACIIASTTLESLESRIWGYVAKLASSIQLNMPLKILRAKPPKIVHPSSTDKIHGMFAIAIRQGEDAQVLSTLIGRHPEKGLMVILDESTDMNPAITSALPNLEQGNEFFQLWAIGNSNSRNDLHGAISTPANGWDSIDPMRDSIWKTTHKNGVCLYFNPYDSPAIKEVDLIKREKLGKFLIRADQIEEKKFEYGDTSDAYFRFVLGYWKTHSLDNTIASEQFLEEHQVLNTAEWAGFYPLRVVAGLDPAFQHGGQGCLLRLGIIGQTTDGKIRLDFRNEELIFRIDTRPDVDISGEMQLARNVVSKLREFSCPVSMLALDATGVGRALGDLILLTSKESEGPIKIISVNMKEGKQGKQTDPLLFVKSPTELWMTFKKFVQEDQIRGLDPITTQQIINRLVILKNNRPMLETKHEFKARMTAIDPKLARSPDEADAAMLVIQAAMIRLGFQPGQRQTIPNQFVDSFWAQKAFAFAQEKRLEQAREQKNGNRPRLVPNFSGSLEDVPKISLARTRQH